MESFNFWWNNIAGTDSCDNGYLEYTSTVSETDEKKQYTLVLYDVMVQRTGTQGASSGRPKHFSLVYYDGRSCTVTLPGYYFEYAEGSKKSTAMSGVTSLTFDIPKDHYAYDASLFTINEHACYDHVAVKTSYQVSYNMNHGSGGPSNQTKWFNESLSISSTCPTRTGYSFLGWSTTQNGSIAYYPGSAYTANAPLTLYAVWISDLYTISYNANGGSGAPANQTKTRDVSLTLSSTIPNRDKYRFDGWSTTQNGTVAYSPGATYTGNNPLTLYAVWTRNVWTVSYNMNCDLGGPHNQTKHLGTTLVLLSGTPFRKYYKFDGWAISKDSAAIYSPGSNFTSNEDTTLYAHWTMTYVRPSVTSSQVYRSDSNGNPTEEGTCINCQLQWKTDSAWSVTGTSVVFELYKYSVGTWTTVKTDTSTSITTKNSGTTNCLITNCSADKHYQVRMTINDTNSGSSSTSIDAPVAKYIIDIDAKTGHIGIGEGSEDTYLLKVAGTMRAEKYVNIFPVGYIFPWSPVAGSYIDLSTPEKVASSFGYGTWSLDKYIADTGVAHNTIYRGKNLGSAVTAKQYAAISAGTFEDLYIGDYWTIGGVNYRIAAFDYYWNCGDNAVPPHHAVIVPDTCLYNAVMNPSNTTYGGYVGSQMYTANLAQAKTTIKAAFSGHVVNHRIYLTNAVSNGYASASTWVDSEVDLMNEQMVYGCGILSPVSTGSAVPANYRVEKNQLPLFAMNPAMLNTREIYWLRDVISTSDFARVNDAGDANCYSASYSFGVRPAFCISATGSVGSGTALKAVYYWQRIA